MRGEKRTWLGTSGLRGLGRLVAVAMEVTTPLPGRRVVGPYRPIGQPSGTRAQGVTRHGRSGLHTLRMGETLSLAS